MSDFSDPNQAVSTNVATRTIRLDPGLFALSLSPTAADPGLGLPAARVCLPPGPSAPHGALQIVPGRDDGWLSPGGQAALIRVGAGGGHAMVTLYWIGAGPAPAMKLERLNTEPGASPATPGFPAPPASTAEVVAHIEGLGDVEGRFGDWMGQRGSGRSIEGFSLAPRLGLSGADFEIRAVLGRDWLSPWLPGTHFCGSRGLALPLRGFCLRLHAAAAARLDFACLARFVDGSEVGPVGGNQICAAPSFAPLEAFQVGLRPRMG